MSNSEESGGSSDVASVLKYIAEREENLGKYSDKLRANVQRIFDVFGDPARCQICGHSNGYVGARVEWNHDEKMGHKLIRKIRPSITMRDEVCYQGGEESWALDLDERGLAFFHEHEDGSTTTPNALEVSRAALKACIQKGMLTAFLQNIADALKEESDEYREVAEIAERMAQAISTPAQKEE